MATTSTTESGAAGTLSGPVDYGSARRLRHRLPLSYLSQQVLRPTFQSTVRQTDARPCLEHLRQLVAGGLWGGALDYLRRFLPPGAGDDIEARPILLFLHTLWAFANIAASASATHATVTPATHVHDFNVCLSVSRSCKLRNILNLILHSPQFRANLNWGVIREKASSMACDLAHDLLTPHDVLPICPRRMPYVKQPPGRPPARAITKLYLKKRRSLPSFCPQPGVEDRSLNQVADLIKECFKAGVSLKLLRSSAPVSYPAKTSGILSATDAGTVNTFQGIVSRKHPRTELSAVQEEPDLKRQRTCIKQATDLLLTNAD